MLGWLYRRFSARRLQGPGNGIVFLGFARVRSGFLGFPSGSSRVPFLGELLCFQLLLGFVWKKLLFPEFIFSLCYPERGAGDLGNAFFRADLVEGLEGSVVLAGKGVDLSGNEDAFGHGLVYFRFKLGEL